MTLKRVTAGMVAATMAVCAGPGRASACDRPGTPDQVRADAQVVKDAQGHVVRQIVFSWRNTAADGERVFWDIEMKDGAGRVIPQPAGAGRPSSTRHEPRFNAFLVGPRETRCFRIKARTGPGTSGCVSALFSAQVCATSADQLDNPNRIKTFAGS